MVLSGAVRCCPVLVSWPQVCWCTRKKIVKVRDGERCTAVGDEIHSGVWGPTPVETLGRKLHKFMCHILYFLGPSPSFSGFPVTFPPVPDHFCMFYAYFRMFHPSPLSSWLFRHPFLPCFLSISVTNMCSPCGCLTFFTFLPLFYLIPIKHAFSLHYKHVDHAIFTSSYPHGIYLYKLVSRVLCSLPSL